MKLLLLRIERTPTFVDIMITDQLTIDATRSARHNLLRRWHTLSVTCHLWI